MNAFKKLTLVAALLGSVLVGCGGGTTSASSTTLSGTAAVGAPIVGGTIAVTCAGGSAVANTATDTIGGWTVTLSGQTLPCALQVSGGTINGVTNTTPYHSLASALGTVNVTPMTDLIVANAAGTSTPNTWFAAITPTGLAGITPAVMTTALAQVRTALNLPTLSAVNPLTTAFTPEAGNQVDDILTALQLAITNTGSSLAALRAAASSPTFTPPVGFSAALNTQHGNTSSGGAAAPAAPTGLAASTPSATTINLAWTAVSGATGYEVYRSTSSNVAITAANKITTNPITTTSYLSSGLASATTYYYKVTTQGPSGQSVGSNVATSTTLAAPTTGGGSSTTPAITSFSPTSGASSAVVTITGTNLTNVSQVLFTGPSPSTAFVAGVISASTATSITTAVPASLAAGSYTVSVTYTGGEAVASGTLTVTAAPVTSTATGLTISPALSSRTSFTAVTPVASPQPPHHGLQYRNPNINPVYESLDTFNVNYLMQAGGNPSLLITLMVGTSTLINGNEATSFTNRTLSCTLTGTLTNTPTCAAAGVVFDKTGGTITFTNASFALGVTTHTITGSLAFTPF